MAATSEAYSSSTSDGGLVALLGQELYEDYFGTGENGGIVVGGSSDTDESQACAIESIVDNLLLEACKAFEEQTELSRNGNSMPTETKSRFAVPKSKEDVANARRASVPEKQTQNIVWTCGMNGRPITTP